MDNSLFIQTFLLFSYKTFSGAGFNNTYHQLFDKYNIDIVLQAHNHNYQRSFPLVYNASSFFPVRYPEISHNQDTKYNEPNAPIFITVGTGVAELHNFTGTVPYVIEQFASYGFLNLDK